MHDPTYRIKVPGIPFPRPLTHRDQILCLGSCFVQTIGKRLVDRKFPVCLNPTGALYNPAAIANILGRLLNNDPFGESELFSHEGVWKSFNHDTSFHRQTREAALAAMEPPFSAGGDCTRNLDTLIITFGTAFVYRHRQTGQVVANCQRVDQLEFTRELLAISEIVDTWADLLHQLLARRPGCRIIATISPVRHLRDDPHENSVSKAHLLAALHELARLIPAIHYFPAYEILLDELRDYRFYAPDMAHPSELAQDHIWQRFKEQCIDPEASRLISRIESLHAACRHEIRHPGSEAADKFAREQLAKIDALAQALPHADFTTERQHFTG